ncbi:MAG: PaaI family thioesterase [Archaeoglobaceae archaeon]
MGFEDVVRAIASAPWYKLTGMVPRVCEDGVVVEMEVGEKHLQALGAVHGGAIASILDSAIGLNINRELAGSGKIAVTSQLNVHYLRSVRRGKLVAKAKPLFIGSKVAVGYGELRNEEGELVAAATATFYILESSPI